ncbi:hypothetical protein [Pontibacter chitinilyticus]|uniref:hypothetical protein n=1 Tax=Pontibacter chitinilyticus TaxID=2674989 RepID=UPI0032190454
MEYNIIVAPNLESLATQVAGLIPMGWKLKGGILEHTEGFAQQLTRTPTDTIKSQRKRTTVAAPRKRTKWIE